jgi:signal transduction histidine kinase
MSLELLIHNVGYVITLILSLVLGIFVLVKGKGQTTSVTYFLIIAALTIYGVAYLIGVNTIDPERARFAFLFTMVNMLTVCFNAHNVLAVLGLDKEKKKGIIVMYSTAAALMLLFITNTYRFQALPKPKLYFPNYYEPGSLYWLFMAFFFAVVIYFMRHLFKAYVGANSIQKNRMKYLIFAYAFAYSIGSIGFLLVYNIHSDPIVTMFLGLYTLPLGYAVLKYEVMDIHVVAKRALGYAVLTGLVTAFISFISFLNQYLVNSIANFPGWIIPIIASLISVIIGAFVWEKIRDVDVLKYEFINNVTHKFRTPLTHIRWLSEEMKGELDKETREKDVEQIQYASMRLFELTNILIDVARDDNSDYLYRFNKGKVEDVINDIVTAHKEQLQNKDMHLKLQIAADLPEAVIDARRLHFAVQILFENAIVYTPKGGQITLRLTRDRDHLLFEIKDSGIGIPKEELPYLFAKFYRAQNARRTDTEGMGIGLFMSKNIIEKHGGKIWAQSEGTDKGSSFFFTLPIK